MHIAYIKLVPFAMKYQNIPNSFRDFSRNCFQVKRNIRKLKNFTELKNSNIPAFRRIFPNGWNNGNFRA